MRSHSLVVHLLHLVTYILVCPVGVQCEVCMSQME